jgi:hypothetical protein
MPPTSLGKPLAVGATIALAGAAVWALLIVFAKYELGILAWGIGGAVGAGIVWAGGHGKPLAMIAGVLALLSIGSGKHFAFQALVDRQINEMLEKIDDSVLAERRADATAWTELGDKPTPEQVRTFAKKHNYALGSVDQFVREEGADLRRFAKDNPDLATWKTQFAAQARAELSFIDYLREDFHPADILFLLLGIATAFGIVSKATLAKRAAILEALRAEAEAKAAADTAKPGPTA